MFKSNLCAGLTAILLTLALQGAATAQKDGLEAKSMPVDIRHLTVLTKTVVIAVNQANLTNNYTVLHALSAPGFRDKNSPKDLQKIFAKLRAANLDMSPIVIYNPQFRKSPQITPNGQLRIRGFFPTQPVQISFDLLFQAVGGKWKLNGISLQPAQRRKQTPRLR